MRTFAIGGLGSTAAAAILLALGNGCGGSGKTVPADGGAAGGSSGVGGGSGGAAGAGGVPGTDGGSAPEPHDPIVQLGEMQTLLADGNVLGLRYFPDEGTSILSYDPFRIMVADGYAKSSVVVTASSATNPLMSLAEATTVVRPGAATDFDNGYAGISAVYQHTDGTYYGFYEAEDQVGTGTIPGTSIPGFYARIGIATSPDGTTWTKGGYVIESFVPKRTPDGVTVQYDQGAAEPGAVASADGKWLYLYYTEHSRVNPTGGARNVVICMARADLSAWPPTLSTTAGPVAGFTKYYQGSFSTDGIGGYDSPVVSPPTTTSNSVEGHATYSSALGKYVMIYGVDAYEERAAPSPRAVVSGLYEAFSDDGVDWRPSATPLISDFAVAQPGLSVSWEGSILWDVGNDTQGWLIYGYSADWPTPPHYLVGRRLSLSAP